MKYYLGFDIGCLECCKGSRIVKISKDKVTVKKALEKAKNEQSKDWKGQHSFELFEFNL